MVLGLNYAPSREPPFQEWYGYSECYASDHLRDVAMALLLAREQMLTVLSPVHHPFVWPELKLNDAYRMAAVIKQAIQEERVDRLQAARIPCNFALSIQCSYPDQHHLGLANTLVRNDLRSQ